MNTATRAPGHPLYLLGRSIGMSAFIWGYPLVETVRTCHAMTVAPLKHGQAHLPFECLRIRPAPSTAADRVVVAPSNDLLYGSAWIGLGRGPRFLSVPSREKHRERYFSLALYDAWTNNFANPGSRDSDPAGETLALVGPGTPTRNAVPPGMRVLQCPTDLVWILPRILVGSGDDVVAARAAASDMVLACPQDAPAADPPPAVLNWVGPAENAVVAISRQPEQAAAFARDFYTNLCQALVDTPPSEQERALLAWFGEAQIAPGNGPQWAALPEPLVTGLQQGAADAVALILGVAQAAEPVAWRVRYDIGRWDGNLLTRAVVAYRGLAALASDEAVYAAANLDANLQALDGCHTYTLRFAPGQLPPADAFWSVTLYGDDYFLYPNPLGRYAIGDRTPGLRQDADGGLTLWFGHADQPDNPNWLPAPAGPFSLSLRLYHPRPEVKSWQIPAVKKMTL